MTLNTIVQGAWALLLQRYSGEEKVLFGATVSGRPAALPGVEQMVGLFINTVPVAVEVDGDAPLADWLRQLQQRQAEAQEYSYLTLPEIQRWSSIPSGTPFFESLLVFENYPVESTVLEQGQELFKGVSSHEQTNYPLTVSSVPRSEAGGTGLHFDISYDTRRFDGGSIVRMMGHLETLLRERLAAKPQAPVAPPANPKPMPGVSPVTTTPDLPVRSSRPSARLAQITVPSMPQAVAATAAKASFLPSMPTPVLPAPIAPAKKDPKLAQNWKKKPPEQLTDAEVLAMPDSEYMNDVQMAFFRLKLVQLKQGILNNAGETTEHLREDTVVVPDPADRATIEEEHALELRTRDRERKLLKKIEQSIARIDAGDYGYCDETGEPIGVGRLLARPTATLSLEAQQRRELKQKMFGD